MVLCNHRDAHALALHKFCTVVLVAFHFLLHLKPYDALSFSQGSFLCIVLFFHAISPYYWHTILCVVFFGTPFAQDLPNIGDDHIRGQSHSHSCAF
jgi:hypothetical protein